MNTRLLACAAIAAASPAMADNVAVSFTYDDLMGAYSVATNTFTANATDVVGFRSSGDVSRLIGTGAQVGNAAFQPGFVSDTGDGDFRLSISVGSLNGDGTRDGSGSFTATDADGDTITGLISGRWASRGGVFADFVGTLSNVNLTGDFFNGQIGDGWDMSVLNQQSWNGAIVGLTSNVGNFFDSDFNNATTGVSGQILIPLPPAAWAGMGTLGVLGVGAVVRRRKLEQ